MLLDTAFFRFQVGTFSCATMHPHHSGGCLTADDRPAFANASYRMSREEFDYAIPSFGHTPGHIVVEIRSAGEKLLFASDASIHPIHLEYPEACAVFDHQPEQMSRTRVELLERAAREDGAWRWHPMTASLSLGA